MRSEDGKATGHSFPGAVMLTLTSHEIYRMAAVARAAHEKAKKEAELAYDRPSIDMGQAIQDRDWWLKLAEKLERAL